MKIILAVKMQFLLQKIKKSFDKPLFPDYVQR